MTKIHPIKLHFKLPLNAEKSVDRVVHTYLIIGEQVAVVDTGVAANHDTIVTALAYVGKSPEDVAWIINTHAHPDHAGGNLIFQEKYGTNIACHRRAARWIEDMPLQARERPVFGFDTLVAGSSQVARKLEDGDIIDLGGLTLQVIFTPGHAPGLMSLLCPEERTILTGDTIPPTYGLPLYYHLAESRHSLQRLLTVSGIDTLHDSHVMEPYHGSDVSKAFQDGLDFLDQMEEMVTEVQAALPADAALEDITGQTLIRMGFDPPPVMPLTMQTIQAHLKR